MYPAQRKTFFNNEKSDALLVAFNCIQYIESEQIDKVWNELLPVLHERTSFHMLDIIGSKFGERALIYKDKYFEFFALLSHRNLMSGYKFLRNY